MHPCNGENTENLLVNSPQLLPGSCLHTKLQRCHVCVLCLICFFKCLVSGAVLSISSCVTFYLLSQVKHMYLCTAQNIALN